MTRWTVLLAASVITTVAAIALAQTPLRVQIIAPENGTQVSHRQEVAGTVSDPEADLWLVIHPMETSEYWVQPPITVKDDGSWKVVPYFGRSPSLDSGKKFELRAFANPTSPVEEGRSTRWPAAAAKSNVVEVVRK